MGTAFCSGMCRPFAWGTGISPSIADSVSHFEFIGNLYDLLQRGMRVGRDRLIGHLLLQLFNDAHDQIHALGLSLSLALSKRILALFAHFHNVGHIDLPFSLVPLNGAHAFLDLRDQRFLGDFSVHVVQQGTGAGGEATAGVFATDEDERGFVGEGETWILLAKYVMLRMFQSRKAFSVPLQIRFRSMRSLNM